MKKFTGLIAVSSICLAILLLMAGGANATSYDVSEGDASWFGNLSQQNDTVKTTYGNYGCGQTTTINSFVYLQRKDSTYGTSLVSAYDTATLANAAVGLNTNYIPQYGTNTYIRDVFWGINTYIEQKVSNRTIYAGQTVQLTGDGAWNTERPKPAWVSEDASYPTWNFIYNGLEQSKAVIIHWRDSSGDYQHYMTVTGMNFTDSDNDGFMDSSEQATITYIDPKDGLQYTKHIWQGDTDGYLRLYYKNDTYNWTIGAITVRINMAESFGSVPLPSTLLLLGSGLLGLAGVGRRWRKS